MQVAPVSRRVRHEHLVVTVDSGIKQRIDADLDAGESLEAWVADAIERKLAAEGRDADERCDREAEVRRDDRAGRPDSDDRARRADGDDRATEAGSDDRDEYDEGFEYVDDCGI
jgi:hypothetical protein